MVHIVGQHMGARAKATRAQVLYILPQPTATATVPDFPGHSGCVQWGNPAAVTHSLCKLLPLSNLYFLCHLLCMSRVRHYKQTLFQNNYISHRKHIKYKILILSLYG